MSHAMRQDLAMFITTFIFENNKLCLEKNMSIILPISPKLVKCSSSVPAASLGKTPRIPFMTRKERRHEIGQDKFTCNWFHTPQALIHIWHSTGSAHWHWYISHTIAWIANFFLPPPSPTQILSSFPSINSVPYCEIDYPVRYRDIYQEYDITGLQWVCPVTGSF